MQHWHQLPLAHAQAKAGFALVKHICAVLCCDALYCAVLCCDALCCAMLGWAGLCWAVLCCAVSSSKSAASAAGTGACQVGRIFIPAICPVHSSALRRSIQGGNGINTLPAWYNTSFCIVHCATARAVARAAEQFLTGPCLYRERQRQLAEERAEWERQELEAQQAAQAAAAAER